MDVSLPAPFDSLPLPFFMRPTAVIVRALNAVLGREPWAKTRLMSYAGRTVVLRLGALELPLSFTHAGTLVLFEATSEAVDVQLTISTNKLSQIPEVLAQSVPSPDDLLALVHIQGDAGFAYGLAQIVSQLRLDPEAEIARFTGDLFAVRLVSTIKQLIATGQRTVQHAESNMAEFLGEESAILVSTDYQHLWQQQFVQLEQRLNSLEQRTVKLSLSSVKG